ncbi:MAG TPA: group 1 truncated hemoglobin [Tepidiformaceae bacterium]|nr:group 1 truncated hemoglobin [Tepidiformaceae bacterium]
MLFDVTAGGDWTRTLYQRLGGADGIAAIIDDVVDRHAVNPALAPRLAGKDLPELKRLGAHLASASTGGPHALSMGELRAAYAGLAINEREFRATVDDILAALHAQGVAPAEVNAVVAILFALQAEACPERTAASQSASQSHGANE